ncbi:mucoidy inhibitor MuiA family protein [Catellatospora sp. KI3]|uniref:DUF4139 domain-containing protein n=1 Tax=Catellatospora sp. KI3 TaxID=3041620 RepID=UPI00248324F5|nr:mucoidy inhibitor MuiA family protein [Catellatospora sp. KI3]MDI1465509.1 mucoidy inhibitor MuiA family protein [Catellatospora sp. KI3]
MSLESLDAPIVAVTVFPDRARVTRRGTVTLPAGEHRVPCGPLPLGLLRDSVRVSGHGPAAVAGVNVITRREAASDDATVSALEAQLREIEARVAELLDADTVAVSRERFLARLAMRGAGNLATGEVAAAARFADGLDEQLTALHRDRRLREQERTELHKRREAVERRLMDLRGSARPDRLLAEILLEVDEGGGEVELELTYLVPGASWTSGYDLRLAGDRLALTWHGMITQRTGEDWPECRLRLSTARPAGALTVPELDPWFVDVFHPAPPQLYGMTMAGAPMPAAAMPAPAPGGPPMQAMAPKARAAVRETSAAVEEGPVAATYTPLKSVAVPADGTAHRTLIATFDLEARLDHITAPVRAQEATLRATVRNTSGHTLPPGQAALFHEGDFVGSTRLEPWAPLEERELALGVDDRVRVERELVRRAASKATLGSTRRTDAEYKLTITNHSPRPVSMTVLDQLPVSRDPQITVRELHAKPEPAERSELGVLTWKLALQPGTTAEIQFGLRVESAKGVEIAGWRD